MPRRELDVEIHMVKFYIDSTVVLGYIYNQSPVLCVCGSHSKVTLRNGTLSVQSKTLQGRSLIPATHLTDTWLSGPPFLRKDDNAIFQQPKSFELVDPDMDGNIRPPAVTLRTRVTDTLCGLDRFSHFSSWKLLTYGMARLMEKIRAHCRALDGNSKNRWIRACKESNHSHKPPHCPNAQYALWPI